MTCTEGVRTKLLAIAPLVVLVSARIWTLRFPQGLTSTSLPAVLVQQVSDSVDLHLRGTNALKQARIQIDIVARQQGSTSGINIARQVDAAIVGDFTGGSPTGLQAFAGTVSGSFVIHLARPMSVYREEYVGEELIQARLIRDWEVHYEA